ncbi:MAG: bacillithiol biosynthesis deacetylase BshB1 [Planctomycetes bacterium]|nr:bacillithiol biosynthesis deacetylase BshB1 [Planctomycetota bacterium]
MIPPFPQLDYLIIACHPDDAEIGCGGAILSLKANGAKVGVLDLTDGEPTPHGSLEIRRREMMAATAILDLDWRSQLNLPNRSLVADLDARRLVAGMIRELRPRVLITHYWEDAHPDHVAASALVDAARFWAKLTKTTLPGEPHYPEKILYFPSMHLHLHVKPSFILDITPHHERKLEALRCYHSQFIAGRSSTPPTIFDDITARARYFGWLIGAMYGEPFLCREEVGVRDLQQLS